MLNPSFLRRLPTLEVRSNDAGTLTVELETEDGTRVSRTFTIS